MEDCTISSSGDSGIAAVEVVTTGFSATRCAISGHIGVVVGRKEQESSASFVACRITGKKAAVFINDRASVIMSECEVWSDVLGVGILQARARLLNCRVIAKLPLSYDVKPELVGCTLTDTAIAGKET